MCQENCCATCFCFRDVRRAIVAIGMLTGGFSFVQILISIAVFTGWEQVALTPDNDDTITYRLYIALACMDFFIIVFSFLMVYGNEVSDAMPRCFSMPWLILIPFHFVYETGINIYYFYHQFNGGRGYNGPLMAGATAGLAVVPLVYWITKAILVFTSWLYLMIRMQCAGPHPTSKVRYVRQVESFHEYDSAPTFPHNPPPMIALPPAPSIPKPSCQPCHSSPMMPMPSASVPKPSCQPCHSSPMVPMPSVASFTPPQRPSPMISMPSASSYMPPHRPSSPMMSMPGPPSFPKTSQCSGCSGGCAGDRCGKCNLPQPLYSYAGMQAGNSGNMGAMNTGAVQSKGWTTSIYNNRD